RPKPRRLNRPPHALRGPLTPHPHGVRDLATRARPPARPRPIHPGEQPVATRKTGRVTDQVPDQVPAVDLATFADAHATGAVVLDVRNPDEYEAGHVAGAKLIPLDQLSARQDEIPEGDPIYVICAMGGRSMKAAQAMAAAGYNVINVAGGTKGWIEQGRPVVSGASER